jgi:hypothetical protein
MADRINIFAQAEPPAAKTADLSRFTPKPRAAEGRPSLADLQAQPAESKFVSREPVIAPTRPAPYRYRTGRNQQFNTRASQQTIDRFDAMHERLGVSKAELMERAIAALEEKLEREGEGRGSSHPRETR